MLVRKNSKKHLPVAIVSFPHPISREEAFHYRGVWRRAIETGEPLLVGKGVEITVLTRKPKTVPRFIAVSQAAQKRQK